jgi:hypothetical protein
VSYYTVATSVIGLVGDSLFEQRRSDAQAQTEQLAVEIAPLYIAANMESLQTRLNAASGEMGGRLMVLDMSGTVQVDSFSELTGSRVELPEVTSILSEGKTVDYGVHQLGSQQKLTALSLFTPLNTKTQWVGYATAAITSAGQTVGLVIFSSPIQDVILQLAAMENRMSLYFLAAAAVAVLVALVVSRLIPNRLPPLPEAFNAWAAGIYPFGWP